MARWQRRQRRADKTRRQPQPLRPPRPAPSPAEPRLSIQPPAVTNEPRVVVREAPTVERLAYTRTQAAQALGISRSTLRRLLPYVETIEMPSGTKLIPADELRRLATERRRAAASHRPSASPGRRPSVPPAIVARIRAERAAAKSLAQIARDLNATKTPTAHGGRQWWPSTVSAVLARSSESEARSGRRMKSSNV